MKRSYNKKNRSKNTTINNSSLELAGVGSESNVDNYGSKAGGYRNNTRASADSLDNKDIKTKLFVGRQQFKCIEAKSSVNLIQIYVQSIMNAIYGHMMGTMVSEWTASAYLNNAPELLLVLFQTILRYNNAIVPYKMKLYSTASKICLGEPMFYQIKDSELLVYINTQIVGKILKNTSETSITMSMEITETDSWPLPQCGQKFTNQDQIFKLFVVADHAATHYLQQYKTGKTDWIAHFGFDKQQVTTLASAFSISANLIRNNKVMIKNLSQSRTADLFMGSNHLYSGSSSGFQLANIDGPIVNPNQLDDLLRI